MQLNSGWVTLRIINIKYFLKACFHFSDNEFILIESSANFLFTGLKLKLHAFLYVEVSFALKLFALKSPLLDVVNVQGQLFTGTL